MRSRVTIFIAFFVSILVIDQFIKSIFLDGFRLNGECISLVLAFNKGVAFSMFEFLGEYLKYIQITLITFVIWYIFHDRELIWRFYIELGALLGAGSSNLLDRFTQEGVVDYLYWHCYFDFAIFNLADVVIDIAIVSILYRSFFKKKTVL